MGSAEQFKDPKPDPKVQKANSAAGDVPAAPAMKPQPKEPILEKLAAQPKASPATAISKLRNASEWRAAEIERLLLNAKRTIDDIEAEKSEVPANYKRKMKELGVQIMLEEKTSVQGAEDDRRLKISKIDKNANEKLAALEKRVTERASALKEEAANKDLEIRSALKTRSFAVKKAKEFGIGDIEEITKKNEDSLIDRMVLRINEIKKEAEALTIEYNVEKRRIAEEAVAARKDVIERAEENLFFIRKNAKEKLEKGISNLALGREDSIIRLQRDIVGTKEYVTQHVRKLQEKSLESIAADLGKREEKKEENQAAPQTTQECDEESEAEFAELARQLSRPEPVIIPGQTSKKYLKTVFWTTMVAGAIAVVPFIKSWEPSQNLASMIQGYVFPVKQRAIPLIEIQKNAENLAKINRMRKNGKTQLTEAEKKAAVETAARAKKEAKRKAAEVKKQRAEKEATKLLIDEVNKFNLAISKMKDSHGFLGLGGSSKSIAENIKKIQKEKKAHMTVEQRKQVAAELRKARKAGMKRSDLKELHNMLVGRYLQAPKKAEAQKKISNSPKLNENAKPLSKNDIAKAAQEVEKLRTDIEKVAKEMATELFVNASTAAAKMNSTAVAPPAKNGAKAKPVAIQNAVKTQQPKPQSKSQPTSQPKAKTPQPSSVTNTIVTDLYKGSLKETDVKTGITGEALTPNTTAEVSLSKAVVLTGSDKPKETPKEKPKKGPKVEGIIKPVVVSTPTVVSVAPVAISTAAPVQPAENVADEQSNAGEQPENGTEVQDAPQLRVGNDIFTYPGRSEKPGSDDVLHGYPTETEAQAAYQIAKDIAEAQKEGDTEGSDANDSGDAETLGYSSL